MNPTTVSKRYLALEDYVRKWFYEPDMEAIRIALAVGVSQFIPETKAVWLFVIGTSGSGKTEMAINSCSGLPGARFVGDMTPRTLVSGFTKKGVSCSLLTKIGPSGILLWKDFTTILQKRVDYRAEIISQLREVHDGRIAGNTGSGSALLWTGKITCIAAVTPAIERAWAIHRDMGERWVQVRWRSGDPIETAEAAHEQQGKGAGIEEGLVRVSNEFVDIGSLVSSAPVPNLRDFGLVYLAQIVAIMRCNVDRDSYTRHISSIPLPEVPTRLASGMGQIARAHATMFRRTITPEDLAVARRVALDSIPSTRMNVMRCIPDEAEVSWAEVVKMSGMPESTVTWTCDELCALGVIKEYRKVDTRFRFTEKFQQLKYLAQFNTYGWVPDVAMVHAVR